MASGVSDQSPPLSSAPANPVQASAPVQAAHQPSATVQAAPGSSASVLAAPLPSSSGQPFISPPAQSAAFLAQPASTASLPPSAAHHLYPLPFFCDPSYYGHYLQSAMKASRGQVAQPPPPSESVTPIPLSPVSSDQEDFSEEDEVVDCNPPALFSFAPSTKEREPSIPDPDSELASQGVVCQKLGSPAWNRRRMGSRPLTSLFITTRGIVQPASRSVIAGWVKTALRGANIIASPGSMRSAVATFRYNSDLPLDSILRQGNWRGGQNFFKYYYRACPVPSKSICLSDHHPSSPASRINLKLLRGVGFGTPHSLAETHH
ncbi:hypothetical protein M8J76_017240 [Diaphorina citri]|nr:hypothetical protein M8J76_017240 [Diaphorina citri]